MLTTGEALTNPPAGIGFIGCEMMGARRRRRAFAAMRMVTRTPGGAKR